jgi:S1-C subfamily serine protease
MSGRLRTVTAAAGLVLAAALGAGLALGGAAVFVGFGGKTTTRVASALVAPREEADFRTGKALSINAIYRRSAPGVVQVTSTSVVRTQPDPLFGFPFPQQETQKALGSGFVIDKAGHIITNDHVIEGARSVQVSFSNNENMKAHVVGRDPSTDVAVLQVDARSRVL